MNKRAFLGSLLALPSITSLAQVNSKPQGCPAGSQFGNRAGPNRLQVKSTARDWAVNFDTATLVIEDSAFRLILPEINDYAWAIASTEEPLGNRAGPYPVLLSGQWGADSCPPVARELFEEGLRGELRFGTLPGPGAGENCSLTFQLTHPRNANHGLFGQINRAEAVSTMSRDNSQLKGSFIDLKGKRIQATSGVMIFNPSTQILEISLNHANSRGGSGVTFHIKDFANRVGLYLNESAEMIDGRQQRVMLIHEITECRNKRIAGRTLWVSLELAQRHNGAAETLLKRAKLLSTFETNDLVTLRLPARIRI